MLVGERMTSPAITIGPDLPVQEAMALMRRDKVRRFPVVDSGGKLIGIVSEKDLLDATPSDATTLSVWEINYLLSKLTVEKVMSKQVITITADTPIEEAARIMSDHKIGGLPVVEGQKVVGIITETNLFKIFLELLGARSSGVRLTLLVSEQPGKLHELTGAIQSLGGNVIALGTFLGENSANRTVAMKISGVSKDALVKAIQPLVERIVDVREMVV